MSLDELRDDLKRNMTDANTIVDNQTRAHLKNTLWPFIEALIDTVEEIDDAVAEMVEKEESYLQPEAAAVFAAIIQSGLQFAAELKKRAPGEQELVKQIDQYEAFCNEAIQMLTEITMMPADEEEEDEDDNDTESTEGGESDE